MARDIEAALAELASATASDDGAEYKAGHRHAVEATAAASAWGAGVERAATAGAGNGGGSTDRWGGKLPPEERFGEQLPFCEPYWYQGFHSPYYTDSHRAFRAKVREFCEKEVRPNVDKWIASPDGYPLSLHEKAYAAGIGGAIFPKEYGGTPPEGYNAFHELIMWDELARAGGGAVLGQLGINSMALPPVIAYGSDAMKDEVVRAVVTGKKHISLAISEPGAGSDVAAIATTAVRDGDSYVINGTKKWITGGKQADWLTMLVRTGGPDSGPMGLSLLLVPTLAKGVHVRKMPTQFDSSHSTTFITLSDVRVPATNMIGDEGIGFMAILRNFNHERFVIACGAVRGSRLMFELALKEALWRRTFGKRLIEHQVIRAKLAEMARLTEALQDNLERVAYQFSRGVADAKLGGQCAMLKVNGSRTFEYCCREASQIFGGSSIVREGRGKLVERAYREVRASAIPGGSEEILLDLAMRQIVAQADAAQARSKL